MIFIFIFAKTKYNMGRNKLPQGEKKSKVDVFVKSKAIEKIGYKKCAEIAVTAIEGEFLKTDKQ